MRRSVLLLAATAAAAGLAASSATAATHECDGLQVCVPVAGPWVLAPSRSETQWRLACPKGYVVGGLDAELTTRSLDLVFRATLGSPVNPGISTSTAAVFLGRLVAGSDPAASFRPHIGCIPSPSGGRRIPTARRVVFPPGKPTVRRVTQIAAVAGKTRRVTRTCKAGEQLVAASAAIGFATAKPPTRTLAAAVHVKRRTAHGHVTVTVKAGAAIRGSRTLVQLDLVCAGGS